MGAQQQILLLGLAAMIVAIAVVVGVNMFLSETGESNQGAVIDDVLTNATRAQRWYRIPIEFGGGGRSFQNVNLDT